MARSSVVCVCAVVLLTAGCGEAEPARAEASGGRLTHTFEPFTLEPGEESDAWCQQWTPGHTETLFVNAVHMRSGGGFHHMNFFYVPEDYAAGPDGTFRCEDRGYNLQLAAIGGGVFYAQSTQAEAEVQSFPAGSAIPVPPGFKILGNQHLLNTGADALTTALTFEIATLAREAVEARMVGFTLSYGALDIPPRSTAEFSLTCDFAAQHERMLGRPTDFAIHRLLPHYHALGNRFRVEVVGGPEDGRVLVETSTGVGEPVGVALDPPFAVGAAQLRLTCGFDNPTQQAVGWGIGDQEMCIAFGFSDSELLWAGDVEDGTHRVVEETATTLRAEAACSLMAARPLSPAE